MLGFILWGRDQCQFFVLSTVLFLIFPFFFFGSHGCLGAYPVDLHVEQYPKLVPCIVFANFLTHPSSPFLCSHGIVLMMQTTSQKMIPSSVNVCHHIISVIYCSSFASVLLWRFDHYHFSRLDVVVCWCLLHVSYIRSSAVRLCLSWHTTCGCSP